MDIDDGPGPGVGCTVAPMSLATRCPACSTVFRVVQDQLRVSEGWVRCGRCTEVFNAVDHMVDMPRPPAPLQPPAAPPAPGGADRVAEGQRSLGATPPPQPAPLERLIESDHAHDLRIQAWNDPGPAAVAAPAEAFDENDESTRVFRAFTPEAAATAVTADSARSTHSAVSEAAEGALEAWRGDRVDLSAVTRRDEGTTPPPPGVPAEETTGALADATRLADAAPTAEDADAPSFVRDAERAERWQRPAVRAALAAGLVLGTSILFVQVALEYRDLVAARWSHTRPALEQLCRWTGCRVEHPRLVDALVVDSSGLVRVDGTSTYRFSVVLRNRSSLTLAMPALDLTLTDTQGRVISRRTLSAVELGVGAATVAAAAELSLQATLGIPDRPVAGYTIEVFYP